MTSSPRRPSQTRKAPTEAYPPAKGGAHKINQPSKSIDGDASYFSSAVSSDGNYEIKSVEENKDNANTTPTHRSISRSDITYESQDSAGYEPTNA